MGNNVHALVRRCQVIITTYIMGAIHHQRKTNLHSRGKGRRLEVSIPSGDGPQWFDEIDFLLHRPKKNTQKYAGFT